MDFFIDVFSNGQLPTGTVIFVGNEFWQKELFRIKKNGSGQYIEQSKDILLTKERLNEKWWIEYPQLNECIEINEYNEDKKLMQNKETKEYIVDFSKDYSEKLYKMQFTNDEIKEIEENYGEGAMRGFSVKLYEPKKQVKKGIFNLKNKQDN